MHESNTTSRLRRIVTAAAMLPAVALMSEVGAVAPKASHEIGFFGNRAVVEDVLANHLRWTGGTAGAVQVSVAVNAYDPTLAFNPTNGHYYEFVSSR